MTRLILLALLCATAYGQSPDVVAQLMDAPQPKHSVQDRVLDIADPLARTLDTITTQIALSNGGHEMILPDCIAQDWRAMAAFSAGRTVINNWVLPRVGRRHPRIVRTVRWIDVSGTVAFAVHNLFVKKAPTGGVTLGEE